MANAKKLVKNLWSKKELNLFAKLFPRTPTAQIAARLGRRVRGAKRKPSIIPLSHGLFLLIPDLEAIEDEIDLKDALKSLNEPGSIGLADFKKKLGI
jgi:hypothetical protein